jgi:hypothetical protein
VNGIRIGPPLDSCGTKTGCRRYHGVVRARTWR